MIGTENSSSLVEFEVDVDVIEVEFPQKLFSDFNGKLL
jgi:hypothetical protein